MPRICLHAAGKPDGTEVVWVAPVRSVQRHGCCDGAARAGGQDSKGQKLENGQGDELGSVPLTLLYTMTYLITNMNLLYIEKKSLLQQVEI